MEKIAAATASSRAEQRNRQKQEHKRHSKNRKRLRIFDSDMNAAIAREAKMSQREKQRREERWRRDLDEISREINENNGVR